MTKRFTLGGILAAFLLFVSGTASAVPVTFDITLAGTISGSDTLADASGSILDFSGWSFESTLHRSGDDVIEGSTWKFTDGTHSLEGTLTGKLYGLIPWTGGGFLNYLITGGTGLLYGATGYGYSEGGWVLGMFGQQGTMTITSVPEPGTTALFAVALVMLGVAAYRRRRAALQS
jgi:hypothetical protein